VLAGMIGALCLQGFSAMEAACFGAWLHGAAGDRVAASRGPVGFLASEVMRAVPDVIREGVAAPP
jgi:ADP-dependent NAD(P)H-hydrate dehydratase